MWSLRPIEGDTVGYGTVQWKSISFLLVPVPTLSARHMYYVQNTGRGAERISNPESTLVPMGAN